MDWNDPENSLKLKTKVLRKIIQWTDNLLLKLFLTKQDIGWNEILRSASIDFFCTVCDLTGRCPFLEAPTPSLCYRLLLSRSPLQIDRLCHLLVRYKTIFQKLKEQTANEETPNISPLAVTNEERIKVFNCYVWDICCALWRCPPVLPPMSANGKVVSVREQSSTLATSILYSGLPGETQLALFFVPTRGDKATSSTLISKALGLTHAAVFAGHAFDFVTNSNLDRNSSCLTLDNIRGKTKINYLDYLQNKHGLEGLNLFLSTFIASLAKKKSSQNANKTE